MYKGVVYWLTGFSGAGKTAIGKAMYSIISSNKSNIVLLDGDELRDTFGNIFGYTNEERLKCAMCYSRMCKLLSEQGIDVICCTISMFAEVRNLNRESIENYKEIYIRVSEDILNKTNQKGLYEGVNMGILKDVVGIDLAAEVPENPDLVIDNNREKDANCIAKDIINKLK
ncbi:adenylyl-sulfate kinase [Clostridium saccharoperbutylacetonicum]|uniref:adenylyl-sulfate kinase n=1 Tax=Clostridium saccharoperbutylacetonicum TaxID=36745 RepID=UPI000983A155|nr:adenylyl-sulfate kinase [Clostridium saccharoperbutylacetonicum]AQR97010.1 putative adenylyl-sulfate kinase [Clostridium saccharoperbutylacetonicum]NSB32889.1 adenylylsulfate kinase [Clostridium saccharoperbutylacetonicum]